MDADVDRQEGLEGELFGEHGEIKVERRAVHRLCREAEGIPVHAEA